MTEGSREETTRRSPALDIGLVEHDAEAGWKPRVLVVSHGHPEISKGGAEIAAFQQYSEMVSRPDCGEAWFLGCNMRAGRSDITITQPFGTREFIYSVNDFDWLRLANRDPRFPGAFTDLLMELSPDVVHFHHYSGVGVEAVRHVQRALPKAKIVVTLHEYLAICNHYGRMVTKPHRNLCYQATPARCSECFPELDGTDFFLRKKYIEHFLDCVDHFIAPSRFLADRYIDWGISASRISVLENVLRSASVRLNTDTISTDGRLRVGSFGQLSFLKGAHIMFEAALMLDRAERGDICFEVFGDYRNQPPEFQKKLIDRMQLVGQNVGLHGPYDETRVDILMQSVDVVIIPSVWWENSPLVIQEAFRNDRPVICSDIGGMAEKVRDGIDGFHFRVGSSIDLASLLKRLADDRQMLLDVARTVCRPPVAGTISDALLSLYRNLQRSNQGRDSLSDGASIRGLASLPGSDTADAALVGDDHWGRNPP